ncbi:MAG: cytidylyltransferase domain-containing protein [Jatrophihabitans sp.]|uniref:cytidylyltransferase domain-containing protein n=1 Tax=Jatrophihabitans sp. TaxID=1932789 RepID=UPI003F812595
MTVVAAGADGSPVPPSSPDGAAVTIIPARGGSVGVPRKNLRRVGAAALVERAVRASVAASTVRLTVVSTDDDEIATVAEAAGAAIVRRPAELSTSVASSESAVLHALDVLRERDEGDITDDTVVVLMQCTSPFIDAARLDDAVTLVATGECEVAISVEPTHRFLWRQAPDGTLAGVNHASHAGQLRERRQDRAPEVAETGAFYALRVGGLVASGSRFHGRIRGVEVAPWTGLEIDDVMDLEIARAVAPLLDVSPVVPGLADVAALVTDFDGVHTDDTAFVDTTGLESVQVSRSDGYGVERLRAAGVRTLILSREKNAVVQARARKLQVDVLSGIDDKLTVLQRWADTNHVPLDRVAYVGNDLPDLPCLAAVGVAAAPSDAHPEVRRAAGLVLAAAGGHGAVREICDLILAARAGSSAAPHPTDVRERKLP